MANLVLRVTPERLKEKAEEFRSVVKELDRHFSRLQSISSKTKGYWHGEAGDCDRSGYASYEADITFIIQRLSEHPTDLLSMAGIYQEAERDVSRINSKLKTDQIV